MEVLNVPRFNSPLSTQDKYVAICTFLLTKWKNNIFKHAGSGKIVLIAGNSWTGKKVSYICHVILLDNTGWLEVPQIKIGKAVGGKNTLTQRVT